MSGKGIREGRLGQLGQGGSLEGYFRGMILERCFERGGVLREE